MRPDYDLDLMLPGQTLAQSSARILAALEGVLAAERPGIVLVQGDTTTTFCGALAAFYARIPVGHVEAGLRTGDLSQPFPEELNRVLTTRLSALHFAPTEGAAENLPVRQRAARPHFRDRQHRHRRGPASEQKTGGWPTRRYRSPRASTRRGALSS